MRLLTGFPAVFGCFVAALVLVLGTEARGVVFDDGAVHVIDANNSFPAEDVFVKDALDGSPTTVVIVPGGFVAGSVFLAARLRFLSRAELLARTWS